MNSNVPKGSVLDELNMSEQDRLELKLKADLHQNILKLTRKKRLVPGNWKSSSMFLSLASANC